MSKQTHYFDLNVEQVLENWTVAHALREIIANAFDEAALTNTSLPVIEEQELDTWIIRDFGRGLEYKHLTQNENVEKLEHPSLVIGKFGVGLKDAFATLDRHHIRVVIRSCHGDMTIAHRAKAGFDELQTLHVAIQLPTDPNMEGTEFRIIGIKESDVIQAKACFLYFSNEVMFEKTEYGDILERTEKQSARIYVNGLAVAEEENFLFSYNITSLTSDVRKALNRERTNVGRTAYTDRVKRILVSSTSIVVASRLAQDLGNFAIGGQHDETKWSEVSIHAAKLINSSQRVVFVTPAQLMQHTPQLDYAQGDGYTLITVPTSLIQKITHTTDLNGQSMLGLEGYTEKWNASFSYTFIELLQLTRKEQSIFAKTDALIALTGSWQRILRQRVKEIRVSETMRVGMQGTDALGLWESATGRIIIKRDQLQDIARFAGTLLHELTHAYTGYTDDTLACHLTHSNEPMKHSRQSAARGSILRA